jgi:hypothetical protein
MTTGFQIFISPTSLKWTVCNIVQECYMDRRTRDGFEGGTAASVQLNRNVSLVRSRSSQH